MTRARKLAIVAAVQILILLSIIGFRQWAVWTGHTVTLRVAAVDPHSLLQGQYPYVRYDISQIDRSSVRIVGKGTGDVYVELQRGSDGYWHAVAIHDGRGHAFKGTVLMKGHAARPPQYPAKAPGSADVIYVTYGIENVSIAQGSARDVPSGSGHDIGVEVQVDRFGQAVAKRFLIDGRPFGLHRR